MSQFTIFGGSGFIGSEIVKKLKSEKKDVYVPRRDEDLCFGKDLGIVIYCAGNGDCVNTPRNVYDANIRYLTDILFECNYKVLVYVSSTRVYINNDSSLEGNDIIVTSCDERRLFNLTKLVSEELCNRSGKPVIIVRPSNVYGLAIKSPLFLPTITRNAILNGSVDMFVEEEYEKDYVSVNDVVDCIIKLSMMDKAIGKTINIASGYNIAAKDLADILRNKTNCIINWHGNSGKRENFPIINIELLKSFIPEYKPRSVLADLEYMIKEFKHNIDSKVL